MSPLSRLVTLSLISFTGLSEAQLRPDLLYCGQSNANGSGLYDGGGPFVELRRCGPDMQSQAILVAQAANIEGRGTQWLDYLNSGGIIITGFGQANEVHNEIYGTDYQRGAATGECADNPMPSQLVNPDHPFWQANPIPVSSNASSCGFGINDLVAGESAVTALGAYHVNGDIKFACRQQGAGTLYLLEADWEDGEPAYTEESRDFMEALIRTRQCETGEKLAGRAEGAEPPMRPRIKYCGNIQRRNDSLFAGTGGYQESDDCVPDDLTQAMFLGNNVDFSGQGLVLRDYLESGGMVITGFNNSHLAYNEIFGTDFERGPFFGNCGSNAMPTVKLSESDPFWQANDLNLTWEGRSPCGYGLDSIVESDPEVKALGADIESGLVGFACRGVGAGSLYLLDHDWSRIDRRYLETSRRFMGALLRSPQCPQDIEVNPEPGPEPEPPGPLPTRPPGEPNSIPALTSLSLLVLAGLIAALGARYTRKPGWEQGRIQAPGRKCFAGRMDRPVITRLSR